MSSVGTYGNQVTTFSTLNQKNAVDTVFLQNELQLDQTDTIQYTVIAKTDSAPSKPTFEQIRYWHWQREKKMLINDSRYITSKSGNELLLIEEIQPLKIRLPIRQKSQYSNDWLTIILLLSLVLLATVRTGYTKYIGSLFQSVINYPTAIRMFGEKNYSILHGAVRLEIVFYIVLSVFAYQVLVLSSLKGVQLGLAFYGKTFVVIAVYFFLKKLIYKLLGLLFQSTSNTDEFLFNLDNFNRVTGIILLPIVALIAYYPFENPYFIVLLAGLAVGGFYIMLILRGISILLKKQFSIFYLFLYLCTLEFLPLLLIYKVVVE